MRDKKGGDRRRDSIDEEELERQERSSDTQLR